MNSGLIYKSVREVWPATVLCGLLVAVFEGLVAFILPHYEQEMGLKIFELGYVRRIVEGMLGTKMADQIGPEILTSIPWVHPVMLSLVLAHAVIVCTRLPSGEVDRGTIDVALGLPISRWQWMLTESVVWVVSVCLVLVIALGGHLIGANTGDGDALTSRQAATVLINLLGLCLCIGAGSWLISSLSNRRGKAVTVAFVLIVVCFLLSYLEQFWEPAGYVSWLSPMSYYRPLFVLRDGHWPVEDLCVLYGAAAVLWACALAVFMRRDLSTT